MICPTCMIKCFMICPSCFEGVFSKWHETEDAKKFGAEMKKERKEKEDKK